MTIKNSYGIYVTSGGLIRYLKVTKSKTGLFRANLRPVLLDYNKGCETLVDDYVCSSIDSLLRDTLMPFIFIYTACHTYYTVTCSNQSIIQFVNNNQSRFSLIHIIYSIYMHTRQRVPTPGCLANPLLLVWLLNIILVPPQSPWGKVNLVLPR